MDRDPLVTHFIPGPWAEPESHRAFVLARMQADYPDGLGYWSVFPCSDDQAFLGWILLLPYGDDEVEIGWRFVRRHWGKGYAGEAAAVILEHGFRTLGLERIVADIDPSNRASRGVAEKLGMHCETEHVVDGVPALRYRMSNSAQ